MEEKKSSPFQDILEKILEHPEQLLGALSILQGLKDTPSSPSTADVDLGVKDTASTEESQPDPIKLQKEEQMPVFLREATAPEKHRKRELLCAIKPYLKEGKKAQLERILHMADLLTLIKNS